MEPKGNSPNYSQLGQIKYIMHNFPLHASLRVPTLLKMP